MALTLPNPSINFVPLDVLTAEELNEIVANIDALAQQFPLTSANIGTGAITNTKLVSGSVTSDKVDYSSVLGFKKVFNNLGGTEVGAAKQTALSLNISGYPTGAEFLVIGLLQCNVPSSDDQNITVSIDYNGDTAPAVVTSSWLTPLPVCGSFTKAANVNIVSLSVEKERTSPAVNLSWGMLYTLRVG